ncbi:hypothetical protein [Vibrio sp. SCSIO 43137]|uniref:hypothetical protein n=1 Tax=Vibrio sp. SCSIO 43137 TaxID=3021011 RepID=UPI002306DDB7|nr:hypothetical protein [Vibrio sp. SCSIO 43137]WCE28789.1 hypothetical protein PK654_10505 [Vibrio sp. SCSIO 43137]
MNISKIVKNEVNSIVSLGEAIVKQASTARSGLEGSDLAEVTSWVTRVGQLILSLYGEKSQHYKNYTSAIGTDNFYVIHSNWHAHVSQVHGVALTVKHDIENDLISNIKGLLQAEIFANFLEIGEHLLNEGYKDAAAVTIGAVLEDGLRELSKKNDISIVKPNGAPKTIEPLNTELAQNEVYSKLVQKQVTSFAHIRNKAAHGQYNEYDSSQVEMMLLFVQGFSEKYLG